MTSASFDGYMWQTLERKARFISQVMHGRLDAREIGEIGEIGDTALSFSEVKALATGYPLLMDKAEADAALARLQRAERAQAVGRPVPPQRATVAGESVLFVDPAQIPSHADVARLGQALAASPARGELHELMASLAAYTGLRWREIAALTAAQIDPAAQVITVDRKVVEIAGRMFTETPKNRKQRRTIYPRATPPRRHGRRPRRPGPRRAARRNQPGRADVPLPPRRHWRASNFSRRVLAGAYHAAGWRPAPPGTHAWTWHSLRHVLCTTALFTWNIDPTDASRLAGHANYRITLDLYIGATAGTLDRARTATE